MPHLVVVESPTKARTIRRFLPKEYRVEASMGHVRDLPASASQIPKRLKGESWSRLGVNVQDGFEPLYVVPPEKAKVVRELKEALKDADELYIATDEDREGESIGWHLLEVLKPKVPVKRMVFHEITEQAIREALDHTRSMDESLIEAQETRRVLDRLVGYTLSPLLWKKVAPKLSAGRVQSVAVRIIVNREKERIAFVPATYWNIDAKLQAANGAFDAALTHVADVRIAAGRDFDDDTGRLKADLTNGVDVLQLTEERAKELTAELEKAVWTVNSVESKTSTRSPAAPFITSTLQQEASRKLRLSARETMRVAQRLYEQGFITYMRTDSTNLSAEAMTAARKAIESRYGSDYLFNGGRTYANKVRNAQEAHEAIRPSGTAMKTADELKLSGVEGKLYDLIWKRTVASQMADARLRTVTVRIGAGEGDNACTFRASGRTIEFPGFMRAYVEGSDDPEAQLEDRESPLPAMSEGDNPKCTELEARGSETKPPARLTDASLIRILESEGIGRPSTYASIIDTIVNRGYVKRQGSQLVPTFTAFATTNLLESNFGQLVDVGFTAEMEQILDDIASGEKEPDQFLRQFYVGSDGLQTKVEEGLDKIDARAVSEIKLEPWQPYSVRVGRYGPYVEVQKNGNEDSTKASLPDDWTPGDVTVEKIEELIQAADEGDRVVGIHPEHNVPVLVCRGPYGYYVQLGEGDGDEKPKRISVPKGKDPETLELDTAVALLGLPRLVGNHPESGKEIHSNIGRYGPYVKHGSTFASLTPEDDVLTVDLDRALALIAKKESRNKALKTVGNHPEDDEPIELFEGRYGPYVKHGKVNASIPKGTDPDSVSVEQAVELLAARAARKKTKGRGRRKK
ncbi:MAG: type I DNA topoisomerase [Rhodothermales bacterium]|nr:type I DNA topoisomerase [Rhodothermales bacterium]MBO6779850.1 type I DNA topoisomerase [Rhodothermales bacterium]